MSDPDYPSGDRFRFSGIARGPLWLGLLLSAVASFGVAYINLVAFPGQAALALGLPLLLCLANRDLRLLYGMAIALSSIPVIRITFEVPDSTGGLGHRALAMCMELGSIWVLAAVIHTIVLLRVRLENKARQLALSNAELEVSNAELATREQEIAQQNEELQAQAEELEQQAEELRQQARELEQQSVELHALNHELTRREKGLQTLLESARWLRTDVAEDSLMAAICRAATEVVDGGVIAAAVVFQRDGQLLLRGHHGFGISPAQKVICAYEHSFASLVMEAKRTAYIQDLSTRPDIHYILPPVGQPFGSVLAAPVWIDGKVVCAVEIYAQQPRHWSAEEFRIAEWVAAQVALALQALEHQAQIEQRRRDAELASVQKTQFLAAVSHDVRTPANAISLLADVIEQSSHDGRSSADVPKLVQELRSNARALVELVSDVLDLAQLDAGKQEIQPATFSLAALIDTEVRQHLPVARAKGIGLEADLPRGLPCVCTDKMKLARVVSNIIGNAVKFTETGEVRIRVAQKGDRSLEISISDSGVGIPPDQLSRIFDEFYQIKNPERDRNKGSGLGLAICKRLADRLGLGIQVESEPGKGSTFRIAIPGTLVTDAPADPRPARPAPTGRLRLAGISVLLVEDHDGTRRAAAQLLTTLGAHVFQAPNGRSAIQMLAHENPDVLLLDLMLPDMDGCEVLRQLRYHRPEGLRCILAVSGDVRPEREAEVRKLGCHGMVAKPLRIDDLLACIHAHLAVPAAPEPPVEVTDQPDPMVEHGLPGNHDIRPDAIHLT